MLGLHAKLFRLPFWVCIAGVARRRCCAAMAWQPPFFISRSSIKKLAWQTMLACQAEVFSPKKRRLEARGVEPLSWTPLT